MIGIDEVGRGCWAGPLLVVAARQTLELPSGLKDSKLLSASQRDRIYPKILKTCQFGEGWVQAAEIDKLGLAKAMRLGVLRSLENLKAKVDERIIMDGSVNYVPVKFTNITCEPKADNKYPIVSAASIYAKVTRDKFMSELAAKHPDYGFDKHVGYGTKLHEDALKFYGVIESVHRLSFKPIREFSV